MSELASAPSGAAAPGRTLGRESSVTRIDRPDPGPLDPAPVDPAPVDPPVLDHAAAEHAAAEHALPAPAPAVTTAGTYLAGRYRLRTRVGSDTAAGAEFWQAEDTVLQRDVAVTVLRRLAADSGAPGDDDDDPTGATRAGEMVVRALRSGSFEHPGCARLLDVLAPGGAGMPDDVLGAAVTEWVPGRSLAEIVADGLVRPTTAARAVVPLAAAAAEAHRHGLVLGCDHPQRVRVTADGRAQLCFVLPRRAVTPADDVRGLGAVLYALLTSHWPLSGADAARAGLAAAGRTPGGSPVPPSDLRPGIPLELDTVVRGALGPDDAPGHVRTAAAVQRLLDEVVAEEDRIALFPPARDGVPSGPGDVWQDGSRPAAPADPRRRRKLAIGLAVLAGAVLAVLGYLGVQLGSVFSEGGRPVIVVGGAPVEGSPADPPAAVPAAAGAVAAPGGGRTAAAAGVEVYDDTGDRDNAGRVSRVIDGNRDSGWNTFTYRQQFPALKPGVGIMVSFASAVQLSSVTIDSPSTGTVVQVRSAPGAEAAFTETAQIGEATLADGATPVSLAGSQPVTHVLVWITRLGGPDGENRTAIDELEFARAGS